MSTPTPPAGPRRCGYSRCRKPLRDPSTGRKRDYCDEADTTWDLGPDFDHRAAHCRELGRAERQLAAATGEPTAPSPRLATVELREQVEAVLPIAQLLDRLGPALLGSLQEVQTALEDTVAAAHAERDAAARAQADAEGRAAAADQAAADATERAAAAEARAIGAERTAEQDRRDRVTADHERALAQGRAVELQTALTEAGQRVTALTDRVEDQAAQLTQLRTQLAATESALTQAERRADTERARAEAAADALTLRERDLTRDHHDRLDQLREQLRTAHAADLERVSDQLRERADTQRAADRERHEHAVRLLHEQAGALTHRASTAEAAQTAATELAANHGTQLDQWRRLVPELLEHLDDQHSDQYDDLRRRINDLATDT